MFEYYIKTRQFALALKIAEKEVYQEAFKYCKGNQSRTARILEVSRGTLRSKMVTLGLLSS